VTRDQLDKEVFRVFKDHKVNLETLAHKVQEVFKVTKE
jgi:hypothetical protein